VQITKACILEEEASKHGEEEVEPNPTLSH